MVFPIAVIPIIIWGALTAIGATAAAVFAYHDKRKKKKRPKQYGGDAWQSQPPPEWGPGQATFDPGEVNLRMQNHSVRGRRPTPYPLYVPPISGDRSDSGDEDNDETIFVMNDAIEGLPIVNSTEAVPLQLLAGSPPHPCTAPSRIKALRCRSSSSIEGPVSILSPSPMSQADNDAISLVSTTTQTKLSDRLMRRVRPSVRFKQDGDVPDYRDILKARRRSSINNLQSSTTVLLGTPNIARSPAESAVTLEEIAEDERAIRAA